MRHNIDTQLVNADWPKAWGSLPPFKSAEFMLLVEDWGMTLDDFRKLPAYARAVTDGLIVRDEWSGKTPTP